MDNYRIEHKSWTVPAPFYAMLYINDARYSPGDTTLETESLKIPRRNNVYNL